MKAWLFHLAYLIAVLTLVPLVPARADFFDDARKTFTIDIPRFFQRDIPCAFGGRPTGHTETSCKSAGHPAKQGSGARHTSHAAKHNVAYRNQESPRVVRRFRDASGQPCRVVNQTVLIDGERTQATGTVCRESDGHWTIAAAGDRAIGATLTVAPATVGVNGTTETDNE
jgi:hypothetical protein